MATQDAVNANDRHKTALELRKAGVEYAEIGKRLGITAQGAHKAVKAALKKSLQEPAEELRTLELERLDALLLAVWSQAKAGNQGAIDRALRIMERRAKLLGLDAPVKQDVTSGGQPVKAYTILANPDLWDKPDEG